MDFLEIVINGYTNSNYRKHLADYFFIEFKKAEKEHFGASIFFGGCLDIVEWFEGDLRSKLFKRREELREIRNYAKSRKLKIKGITNPEEIEQFCNETVRDCDIELNGLGVDSFYVQLYHLTNGKYNINFCAEDVKRIRKGIEVAKDRASETITENQTTTSTPETWNEQPSTLIVKPIFSHEHQETIYNALKDFFSDEYKAKLKELIETGGDAKDMLLFLDNGNRLADAFKQLKDADIITGCTKQDLENWIMRNFMYYRRGKVHNYGKYLRNIISSTGKDSCQKPIFNVHIDRQTGIKSIIS